MATVTELGPPGLGDSAAGHSEALERRRRRLMQAAGFDPSLRTQTELSLDFTYWRADRWDVESRWKPHVAKVLCPDSNPWTPHQLYLHCRTECIARNACKTLRRQFPGKSYRVRPVRWTDAHGNRYPSQS